MKICQIVASYGMGGLEKHVQELSNELAKTQDVTLIAPAEMQPYIADSVRFVPMDFTRSRHNPLLLLALWRQLRQGGFDIIHAQANKATSLVSKIRWGLSGKIIGTIHNCRPGKGSVFKHISHVIAVSREAIKYLDGKVPVSVVYNGITANRSERTLTKRQICDEFSLDADKPLLCSIGRLVHAKGFDLLIDALPEVDVNLLIIGDGKLRAPLQSQIDRRALGSRVKLTGYRNDVAELLGGMDGMIISSRHEGFSYVFIEALKARIPVLSTDVPAPIELLPEALIMEQSAASISAKLQEYVFAPEDWRRQMQEVFIRAEQELTLETMTERTLAVYQKVLAAGNA